MTNKILKVLVGLPAFLFLVIGLRWLVDPGGVAPEFGFTLATGVGLSTQVGDMSAFMLLLSFCIMTALVSGRRLWYYPPIMLLSLAAMGRIVAWLFHGAALPLNMIAPEIIVPVLLFVASRRLPERD